MICRAAAGGIVIPSISTRHAASLFIGVTVAICSGIFVLITFRSYQDLSIKALSGQDKSLVLGQIAEAKLQASIELSKDLFIPKIQSVVQDLNQILKEHPDYSLETSKDLLSVLGQQSQSESSTDLFVQYRNIKALTSNLNRSAVMHKWLNVAKSTSLMAQDLENLPYDSAHRALDAVSPKIAALKRFLVVIKIAPEIKSGILGQLDQISNSLTKYNEELSRSEKNKEARDTTLKRCLALIRTFNEQQTQGAMRLGTRAQDEYMKSVLAIACAFLFCIIWYGVSTSGLKSRMKINIEYIQKSLQEWSAKDPLTISGFPSYSGVENEWKEVHGCLDQFLVGYSKSRREDLILKKTFGTPYLLLDANRTAVYWNNTLCNLLKIRSFLDTGSLSYVAHFSGILTNGRSTLEPVEKAYSERTPQVRLVEILIKGEKGLIEVSANPILDREQQIEYVLVQIKDVREEFKKIDNELSKQCQTLNYAISDLRRKKSPEIAVDGMRKAVVECLQNMKDFAVEIEEQRQVQEGRIQILCDRLAREGHLKKSILGRTEQVRGDLQKASDSIPRLYSHLSSLLDQTREVVQLQTSIANGAQYLGRAGGELDIKIVRCRELLNRCVKRLGQVDALVKGVRSRELLIRNAIDKGTLIQANNAILLSRPDVTLVEISSVLDSFKAIHEQFERGYEFIRQSVDQFEFEMKTLYADLKEGVTLSAKLSEDDRGVVNAVKNIQKLNLTLQQVIPPFAGQAQSLIRELSVCDESIQFAHEKNKRLVKIGQASLELQNHIESGVRKSFLQEPHPTSPPQELSSGEAQPS